jgi:hypothetical protein
MKAGRLVAVLVIALLGVAMLGGTQALAGKKKGTKVIFFTSSPKINKGGKVTAKGTLKTASACKPSRGVRLQVVNQYGGVIATLDGSTTDTSGNWKLSAQLPKSLPSGPNAVRVKANKRTAGKFVCKAGFSPQVAIPAT